MKKLFFAISLSILLCFSTLAFAGTSWVKLGWDANSEPDLVGYRLYRSTVDGVYAYGETSANLVAEIPKDTTPLEYVDRNIPDGTYYWVVTAYDSEGHESGPSNQVSITFDTITNLPPAAPQGLNIKDHGTEPYTE